MPSFQISGHIHSFWVDMNFRGRLFNPLQLVTVIIPDFIGEET